MKHQLGILGLGNRSTLYYLNSLNQHYNELNGGYSTCPYLLLNVDFNTINPFLPNQFQNIIPPFTKYIEQLLKLGAQKILIPNITLHEALDKIEVFDKDLFIHPLHLLKKEILLRKEKTTVLIGTRHSMNNPYFNSFINNEGLQIYTLESQDQLLVDEFRTAIYHNSESESLINRFESLLSKLEKQYTIIVACTEISAFYKTRKVNYKNTLDLALMQIKEAVFQANL